MKKFAGGGVLALRISAGGVTLQKRVFVEAEFHDLFV